MLFAAVAGLCSGATAREGSTLDGEFAEASERYGVPEDLLKAMGYVNTRWEMPPPDASAYEAGEVDARGTYGVMALWQNPSVDTVARAAELTGLAQREIKGNRRANVLGGAAVLAEMQGDDRPDSPDGWYDALAEYGQGALYADGVFEVLKKGASGRTSSGERLTLEAHPEVEPPATFRTQAAGQYPGSTWYGAVAGNYAVASRPPTINKVVIHVAQGSYEGTLNWFRDSRANVAAHYTVASNGRVGQSVLEKDVGYHANSYNGTSIGIEHEGFVSEPRYFTDAMYRTSAKLTAYLCKKYNIPVDRQHIVGHNEVPDATHTDPGNNWNWTRYMDLVRSSAGEAAPKKTPLPGSANAYDQVADNAMASRFRAPKAWGTADWSAEKYGADYRHLDRPLKTRDPASFLLDVPRAGSYEVFAWWSADPSRSGRVTYVVDTADGNVKKVVDQRQRGGRWVSLGTYEMEAGDNRRVRVQSTSTSDGKIIADAVGLVAK